MSVSHNHLCERRLSVVVVGSAVYRNYFSEWYTNKVVELLTRCGYDIVQWLSALPDDDFVYWRTQGAFFPPAAGTEDRRAFALKDLVERRLK